MSASVPTLVYVIEQSSKTGSLRVTNDHGLTHHYLRVSREIGQLMLGGKSLGFFAELRIKRNDRLRSFNARDLKPGDEILRMEYPTLTDDIPDLPPGRDVAIARGILTRRW